MIHALRLPQVSQERLDQLFANEDLGRKLESVRSEWLSDYDAVLMNSPPGLTDVSAICLVHLADVIVELFTPDVPSIHRTKSILLRALDEHARLPVDRTKLIAVPMLVRTAAQSSARPDQRMADEFQGFFADWLPKSYPPLDAIEMLAIQDGASPRRGAHPAYVALTALIEGKRPAAPSRSLPKPLERIRMAMWMHRFRAKLLRQASRVASSLQEAEDATQEVMLRAAQRYTILRDRPDAVVQAYLRATLVNYFRTQYRRSALVRHAPALTEVEEVHAPADASDKDLAGVIDQLPAQMRLAMELRLQGHSYRDIAKQMNVEIGTVGAWLAEARRRLRDGLQGLEKDDEPEHDDVKKGS